MNEAYTGSRNEAYGGAIKTKGTASFVVATSASPQVIKDNADYITDGTADNVQIQAALDEAAAAGGGQVFLVAGAYSISAKLTIDDGVWLCGVGNQTILTLANGADDSILQNTTRSAGGDSNIRISDIRFDGNKSNNTNPSSTGGVVDMMQISNLVIQNIEIVEADMVALEIRTCNTVKVSGCYIATANKDGIAANLSSYDVIISDNIIFNCGHVDSATNAGIEIQDGTYNCTLSNNIIDSCAYGIEISAHVTDPDGLPCYNVTLISNTIKDFKRGIAVFSADGDNINYGLNITANTVIDTIDSATRYCLYVDYMDDSVISGNTFINYQRAVEFRGTLSDIIFSNNIITSLAATSDNGYTGVKFFVTNLDVDRFLFSGNLIDNYGWQGLHFDGGNISDLTLRGNSITNCDSSTGKAIIWDAATYERCVLDGNYLEGANHTVRDGGGSVYEELPAGWRCLQPEPYNKRTLTAATEAIGADETGKLFLVDLSSNIVHVDLPAAVVGLEFTFVIINATANGMQIDPNGTETIALANGAQAGAGTAITNADAKAINDGCRLVCRIAGTYEHFDSVGTWTAP